MSRTVTVSHDAIDYIWHDVPEKKYLNWKRMKNPVHDTTTFRANGYPYMLQIEPTSLCNLACPLCPAGNNELTRERRHLTFSEFTGIIDDMEEYLLFLVMWDWGEPLLNPDLPAMIRYASERNIKTVTSTNAHFLRNESYLSDLLTSGLTTLIVAIDSLSEEKYEVYRKKGNLTQALEGLQNLVAVKKSCGSDTQINLRMVIMKHNEHETVEIRKEAERIGVDLFTIKTLNPSCGVSGMDGDMIPENPEYRRYEYIPGTYQRIRQPCVCNRVWEMSDIFSNGDVVPCCYDYNSAMKAGNIHDQKFSEIWTGFSYRDLRRVIFENKDAVPACRECGINYALSLNGWFVEAVDFHNRPGLTGQLTRYGKRCWRKALRMVRRYLDSATGVFIQRWPGKNRI